MKRTITALLLTALSLTASALTADRTAEMNETKTTTADGDGRDFVKGADVGFLTAQERRGVVFHDRNGKPRECLELLKNDYQMSAIRMRVWVDPKDGNCDKHELLAMARRVKALGMDLMVDFHYSDSWADPGKQPIPQAWRDHDFREMKQDVRQHTIDVLSLLKENGITPRWVQVGNETTNGLLWPTGHIDKHPEQYAGFIRAGYDAVKAVFPEATVIVHLDRGHRQDIYDRNLDTILKYGGRFDMIGMSLYPYWARQDQPELKDDDIVTDCMANIRHVSRKYGCDVMIVETGYEVDESRPEVMEEGRRLLTRVVSEAQRETDGHCRGVFYWEPQCLPGGYRLGAFDSNAAPTAIMEGFVEPQEVTLTVTNPSDMQRLEVVEADLRDICRRLAVDERTPLKVTNALGQEMTYQKSYDGKLLLSVAMQPKGEAVYTVSRGEPTAFRPQVTGRLYPERLDDLTWENDRGIYRMYGPALQRTGERSFGTDVWVKNTPDPVVEARYRQHNAGWRQGDSLRRAGKVAEGEARFRDASFHLDHGYGMDVYAVGPSLGCGAPALMKDGQLCFPYCFEDCQILDNGPLRFTAELTYGTTAEGITEHRRVSLDKGAHYNKMTVWYSGITAPTDLAAGVVLHSNDNLILAKDYLLYADPTDNPKVHQSQIYVGTIFTDGVDETIRLDGKPGHAVGISHQYKGTPYTYYFGSAWSNYDVRSLAQWQMLTEGYLQGIREPLRVTLR